MEKFTDTQKQQIAEFKKIYSVKNVKTFMGMEWHGVNATLYKNGQKLADVIDNGNGGDLNFRDWKIREELNEELKEIGEYDSGIVHDGKPMMMKYDAETFVNELIDEFLTAKTWKRKCSKKTCIITTDCKKDEYIVINAPYNDFMKQNVTKKYGTKLIEIINERYLNA